MRCGTGRGVAYSWAYPTYSTVGVGPDVAQRRESCATATGTASCVCA